jgi:hypothetical protein
MKVYTINPGVIAGSQFSCTSPYNPNPFTSTSGGTTSLSNVNNFSHTYQWESATNINGPWTAISGATNATYNSPNLSSTTYFRRVLEVTIGSNNPVTESCISNVLTVQVLNAPTISAIPCINNGATASISVNFNPALPSGFTATYQWSGPNSFNSSNAAVSVPNFTSSNAGTYFANVTVAGNGNSCPYPFLSTTLNLNPNTPTFTLPANGCPSTNYNPTGFTPQSGVSYVWTVSPSNNSTGLSTSSPTFVFGGGGSNPITYSVSVVASLGSCSLPSTTQNISILNLANAAPEVSGVNLQVINGVNTYPICSGTSTSTALVYNNNFNNPPNTSWQFIQSD